MPNRAREPPPLTNAPSTGIYHQQQKEKNVKDLNEMYRAEGWGKITDAAFLGRVEPENVESAARQVARYAHEQITRRDDQMRELIRAFYAGDTEAFRKAVADSGVVPLDA